MRRRTMLQLAGLGAAATALPRFARADEVERPLNVLFVYSEGGWTAPDLFFRPPSAPESWRQDDIYNPANFRRPDESRFEFGLGGLSEGEFSEVLRPLHPVREKMMVLEGLGMLSTAWDPHGDDHAKAHIAALSGTSAVSSEGPKSRGGTMSIDQRILQHLRTSDPGHFSLNFRPRAGRSERGLFHEWLYRENSDGSASRLPVETNPDAAFDRLFSGFDAPDSTPDARQVGRRRIFEMLDARYAGLAGQLGGGAASRLQDHRALLSEIAARQARPMASACSVPGAPPSVDGMSVSDQFDSDFQAFGDLVAASFACGLSRVASIGPITPMPEAYGLREGTSIHHAYEHESNPFDAWRDGVYNPTEQWRDAYAGMLARNVYQANALSQLLQRFDSIRTGDGSTLLDDTLVVYVSELAHGGHGHEAWPVLLFGATRHFRSGRYIKYPQDNPNPWGRNYRNRFTCTPHSPLLVSICQMMGMEIDHIHQPSILGRHPSEQTISMSGPLEGLR